MKTWLHNYSLRQRVLTGLFIATIGYWSVIAAFTVQDNIDEVHELYDIHLAHTALALLRVNDVGIDALTPITGEAATGTIKQLFQLWPDLPQRLAPGQAQVPASTEPPHTSSDVGVSSQIVEKNVDHGLTLRYQLWRADGYLMFQSVNAPSTPMTDEIGFSKHTDASGKVWRNYSIWSPDHRVRAIVSEGNDDRMQLVRSIAIKAMNPIVLGMPFFILLLWLSVSSGLGPLTDLSKSIARRDASSLEPLDDNKSPRELKPIVLALNKLIGRMKQVLENERRFNANAAHELNTPLAAIQAHLYVARNAKDDAARARALDLAQIGVERGIRLVGQMLALARLDPQSPRTALSNVDLSDIAQNVCAELFPLAVRHGQTLELVAAPQPMLMPGNPDLLHRLIGNLVDNAIRYAASGGNIQVEVSRVPSGLRLTVQDDGPGIPAGELNRVFDRYYRLADQSVHGTGLGLAICRSIVEIHQGNIALSQGPGGKGLSVQVDFLTPTPP
jgi:signal transduction histidine kinase